MFRGVRRGSFHCIYHIYTYKINLLKKSDLFSVRFCPRSVNAIFTRPVSSFETPARFGRPRRKRVRSGFNGVDKRVVRAAYRLRSGPVRYPPYGARYRTFGSARSPERAPCRSRSDLGVRASRNGGRIPRDFARSVAAINKIRGRERRNAPRRAASKPRARFGGTDRAAVSRSLRQRAFSLTSRRRGRVFFFFSLPVRVFNRVRGHRTVFDSRGRRYTGSINNRERTRVRAIVVR